MPEWKKEIEARLAGLNLAPARELEIADELAAHLEDRYQELRAGGVTEADAYRAALAELRDHRALERELGRIESAVGPEPLVAGAERKSSIPLDLARDLHYGLRVLARTPGFTAVAVLTLALGIGINTGLFSVVNGVLLNPLPFPRPDQLVTIDASKPNFEHGSISYPNFMDWRDDNRTFSAMAVYRPNDLSLTGMGEPERISIDFISSDFFFLLGVKPVAGRWFAPGEDRVGAGPVVLISEGLWQRKFGSSRGAVGKTLTLDGRNYTIAGVVPAAFHLQLPGFHERDLYLLLGQWDNNLLMNRSAGLGIHGIGRLKPGVTLAQAKADMDRVTRNLTQAYP
ncbi:MAG TPA: ABC transporter permease, partial [Terriglobia bacterium]|nr:ABC transporter permease [Terriglobia bacterium]